MKTNFWENIGLKFGGLFTVEKKRKRRMFFLGNPRSRQQFYLRIC